MSAMQTENNQADTPVPYDAAGRPPAAGPAYQPGRGGPGWPLPGADPLGRRRKSPALATVLSLMPGLGQVYVGYYMRGFINVIVVATTITLLANGSRRVMEGDFPNRALDAGPLLGLFLSFFWLYNMIDAWRLASLYNEALIAAKAGVAKVDLPMPSAGGALAGGIVLVAVGLILLLNTMFGMSLDWIQDWWPLAPIGFGIYLITQAVKDRRKKG